MGHTRCPKDYGIPQGLCIGKISESLWSTASNTSSPSAASAMSFFHLPGSRASLIANHKRWSQICCETSWSFSGNTSNKSKICCRKSNSSLLFATRRLNLQHRILLRDKLATEVVIRATESFNLHCNNVARQVEEKCCPYYRTLRWLLVISVRNK